MPSAVEPPQSIDTRIARLTPRQKECLRLVYRGRTAKEIGAELGLSPGTVGTYCTEAIAVLGARNRRHAAELLIIHEGEPERQMPPQELQPKSFGDAGPASAGPSTEGSGGDWRQLLPFRHDGVPGNDLSYLARAIWIVLLAVAIAVGLGMLAVVFDIVGRIYRSVS